MREPVRSTTGDGQQARAAQSPDSLYHGSTAHSGGPLPPMANGIRSFAGIPGFSLYSFPASGRCATQSHPPNHSTLYDCCGRSVLLLGVSGQILKRIFLFLAVRSRWMSVVAKPGYRGLGYATSSLSIGFDTGNTREFGSMPTTCSLEGSPGWPPPFAF